MGLFIYLLKLYAAAGAILGHNYPFYLNFKGGKGGIVTATVYLEKGEKLNYKLGGCVAVRRKGVFR